MIEPRLTMDELGDAFGNELTDALEAGRWLQAAIDETTRDLPAAATGFDAATEARGDFGDRVMAALAAEPAPAPAGFLLPLRRRGFLRGLWASFRQASVATRGAGRPIFQRVAAFAYVLVLAFAGLSLTGVATFGALGMLPSATESTPPPPPSPTTAPPTQPSLPTTPPSLPPDATPSPSPSPSESAEETDGPDEPGDSDDDGGNSGPGGDGGDTSGPGSSGSGSGSSGSGSTGSSGTASSGSGSAASGSRDSGSGSDGA